MLRVINNIAANFAGKFYNAVLNLAFVPIYIKFIGIEGYGLVGFYATLQALFNLLDIGFSNTLRRELASTVVSNDGKNKAADTLLTIQGLYLVCVAAVCILTLLLAPLLAKYWLNTEKLTNKEITHVLILFGFVIANRMLYGFYSGGLLGLQKHYLFNFQDAIYVTLRSVGGVFVLWRISPTIIAFFTWQVVIGFAWTAISALLLWRSLQGRNRKASFRISIIKNVWNYAAGLSLNSILGVVLTQLDKIILTKMLPLEIFGYYTLASTVSSSLQYFGTPVITTYFPMFVNSITRRFWENVKFQYHCATQVMAVLVLPISGVFIFFSHPLLLIWTRNSQIADNAWFVTSLLSLAVALNQITGLPHNLQLAYKCTRYSVVANLISVIFILPSLYFGIHYYGILGAAWASVFINLLYMLFFSLVVHRIFLIGDHLKWILFDIVPTVFAVVLIGFTACAIIPTSESRIIIATLITAAGFCMVLASAFVSGLVRRPLIKALRNFFNQH